MLDIKNCLKISYQGEVSFIICDAGSSYEEIINQGKWSFNFSSLLSKLYAFSSIPIVCARFRIPETQRAGLMLTNGQGYEFEKQLLEYFLMLFPCPELLFQLRINWQRLRRALLEPVKRRRSTGDLVDAQPRSEAEADPTADYVAVPVHRQNCFIGALPGSALAAAVRQQSRYLQQRQQQTAYGTLHQLQPEQPEPQSEPKRMRLQLTNTSRRSAPSAGRTTSLLATAKRSIRI